MSRRRPRHVMARLGPVSGEGHETFERNELRLDLYGDLQ